MKAMKSSKKIIIFAGNCNATDLAGFFSSVEVLKDDFEFHPIAFHITPVPGPEMMKMVEAADTIFIQGIAEAENFERTLVPNNVHRVGYPNLLRRAFWPFDGLIYGRDTVAEADAARGGPVRFTDGVLAKLRNEIADHEARFNAYRDLKVRGLVKNFTRLLEMENENLENLDQTYGCALGAYLRQNARSKQLFHWLGHPSGLLYRELMSYCCDKLRLSIHLPDPSSLDGWGTMQVPIHPMVADQLGLDWAQPDRRYHYAPLGHPTWEEYTKMYIHHLG